MSTLQNKAQEDLIENDYVLIRDFVCNLSKGSLDHLTTVLPIWIEKKAKMDDWQTDRQSGLDDAMEKRMSMMNDHGPNPGLAGIFIDSDDDSD